MWKTRGTTLITFFVWDYLTVAGTRLVVERSRWAIALALVTTILWISGTRLSVQGNKVVPFILVGVALGTLVGITWP